LADRGFGLTKQLVLQKAAKLCRLAQLPHSFKEEPAGDSWYRPEKEPWTYSANTILAINSQRGCNE